MDELVAEVGARAAALWGPGMRVAVACSGGADSLALLHLLHASAAVHQGQLSAVTVDHGLRPDSAEDAAFVAEQAAALGLPCTVERVSSGPSEQAARRARYAVLDAVDAERVALAHHADDQVETVLINLLRGTGPRGLAGMRAVRGRYVRPLLATRGEALRAWLVERGIGWREDPSNASPRYLRNRVRAELIPLLESLRPGAVEAILRTRATLAELDAHLRAEAAALGPLPWTLSGPVDRAVLRRAVLDAVPGCQNHHADEVLLAIGAGRGAASLPGGHVMRVSGPRVWLDSD